MTAAPGGMVSSQLARKIAQVAAVLGADLARLLAAVGLAPEALSAAEGRIPVAAFIALFEEAARATGDDAFGLHVAELARRQGDNPLALAIQSSRTLGEAYLCAARYVRLINDTLEIQLAVEGRWCRLSHHQRSTVKSVRHGVECALAMLALLGRQSVGPRFRLERVSFQHAAPASTAEHTRIFEVPLVFGAPEDALVLPCSLLDEPMPVASERTVRHLDRLLDEMLAELPRRAALGEQVRAALAADLRSGPTLEGVAARLGTTPRSLQRRLREEGGLFQDLLDELRRELSQRYLGEPDLTLAEVAFSLGFAEQSAFHRAFRRWAGTTPAEWRRAHTR